MKTKLWEVCWWSFDYSVRGTNKTNASGFIMNSINKFTDDRNAILVSFEQRE